jgi:hypothetical protein
MVSFQFSIMSMYCVSWILRYKNNFTRLEWKIKHEVHCYLSGCLTLNCKWLHLGLVILRNCKEILHKKDLWQWCYEIKLNELTKHKHAKMRHDGWRMEMVKSSAKKKQVKCWCCTSKTPPNDVNSQSALKIVLYYSLISEAPINFSPCSWYVLVV